MAVVSSRFSTSSRPCRTSASISRSRISIIRQRKPRRRRSRCRRTRSAVASLMVVISVNGAPTHNGKAYSRCDQRSAISSRQQGGAVLSRPVCNRDSENIPDIPDIPGAARVRSAGGWKSRPFSPVWPEHSRHSRHSRSLGAGVGNVGKVGNVLGRVRQRQVFLSRRPTMLPQNWRPDHLDRARPLLLIERAPVAVPTFPEREHLAASRRGWK